MQAQVNLVRNGGFEEETTDTCGAYGFGSGYSPIKYWYQNVGNSPDYFKSCSRDPYYYLPYNFAGYQLDASTGSSYAGIGTYVRSEQDIKEVLMTELTQKLSVLHQYLFTMYVSRRDDIVVASNIGFCLEHDSIAIDDHVSGYLPTSGAFVYQIDTTIKDCENWVKFQHIFTPPSDGLQELVIGNFRTFHTKIDSLPLTDFCGPFLHGDPYGHSYYLIDDVSLYCLDCDTSVCHSAFPQAFTPNGDGINDEWKPIFTPTCNIDSASYLMRIFDRWGNIVFTTSKLSEGWKASDKPIGSYIFYVQYDESGETKKKQGTVELLR